MTVNWREIKDNIKQTQIKYNHRYLLMVSGGADSMFMLDFFKRCNVHFDVAHFQHHIRSNDGIDRCLVTNRVKEIPKVNLFVGEGVNLKDSPNQEAEARTQRWNFIKNLDFNKYFWMNDPIIVTAHHLNDNIEQVFLDLMRGAGHDRLGMKPIGFDYDLKLHKYKPFLEVPKSEILEQCKRRHIAYVEDETNQDNHHERNWLRNEIIPQLMTRRNLEKSMAKALQK